jgi:hypothetical protein
LEDDFLFGESQAETPLIGDNFFGLEGQPFLFNSLDVSFEECHLLGRVF